MLETVIVSSYAPELNVDELVASTASTDEMIDNAVLTQAQQLASPEWKARREKELIAKQSGGTITDQEDMELQTITRLQALDAQAARLEKLKNPQDSGEVEKVMKSTDNFVAASGFLGEFIYK